MPRPRFTLAALAVVATLTAACGGDGDSSETFSSDAELKVVATVDPIADIAQRVGGKRVDVHSIVPDGVDGHTFSPRPSDLEAVGEADIVLMPSFTLNPGVTRMLEGNLAKSAEVIDLTSEVVPKSELVFTDSHSHGTGASHGHEPNAHTWTNVPYAIKFAGYIADQFAEADKAGQKTYIANAEKLIAELEELDGAIKTATGTVPQQQRKLVVYHDSWTYFGRTYGYQVIGAIQARDFSEPSAAEFAAMVQQIQRFKVPAFFGSEVFPSDVMESIATDSGAKYVGDLSDDKLPGKPGDPGHSYLGMMVNNARTIIEALGGDATSIDAVDPSLD